MDALQYDPHTNILALNHIPIPSVKEPHEVLIEVKNAGLCGTDIHIMEVCVLLRLI